LRSEHLPTTGWLRSERLLTTGWLRSEHLPTTGWLRSERSERLETPKPVHRTSCEVSRRTLRVLLNQPLGRSPGFKTDASRPPQPAEEAAV